MRNILGNAVIIISTIILLFLMPFVVIKIMYYIDQPKTSDTYKCLGNCHYQLKRSIDKKKYYLSDVHYSNILGSRTIYKYKNIAKKKTIYILTQDEDDYIIFNYQNGQLNEYKCLEKMNSTDRDVFNEIETFNNLSR